MPLLAFCCGTLHFGSPPSSSLFPEAVWCGAPRSTIAMILEISSRAVAVLPRLCRHGVDSKQDKDEDGRVVGVVSY